MVITITSRSTKAEIEAALKALEDAKNKNTDSKMKPFDAHKYCGIITLKEDPLTLQKRWRNEGKGDVFQKIL